MNVNYSNAQDTASLLHNLKEFCNPALRLGDVYGPTEAFSLQIDFKTNFMLVDINSGTWKIGFFKAADDEATEPLLVLQTNIQDVNDFTEYLRTFLAGIDKQFS